jgi:predicted carbohydrate-binding protein with CBM5 and CBM33 domain
MTACTERHSAAVDKPSARLRVAGGAVGWGLAGEGRKGMTREGAAMIIRRLAAVGGAVAVAGLVPALPAEAHGTPTTPISRAAACASAGVGSPGGTRTGTAACKAARAANGRALGAFDNIRLPGVDGNDRRIVPDGELCSAGIAAFRGLDLARDDFPATEVGGGQTLKIKYRTTIPHEGSFRIYLTRPGYDPLKKLTWDDLASKPLAEIADPPIRDGAYVMSAKLPERTGRHLLYIVWQNTSTPDTYYSCSDLVFPGAAPAAEPTRDPSKAPTEAPSKAPAKAAVKPAATSAAPAAGPEAGDPPRQQSLTPVSDQSQVTLGHYMITGAILVGVVATGWAMLGGILRRRRENR